MRAAEPGAVADAATSWGPAGGIILALLYGTGRYIEGALKDRRARKNADPPAMLRAVDAEASYLAVERQRATLEAELAAEREAHAAERAQHAAEVAAERAENTRLRRALAEEEARNSVREDAMHQQLERLEERVQALLEELAALKRTTGNGHSAS